MQEVDIPRCVIELLDVPEYRNLHFYSYGFGVGSFLWFASKLDLLYLDNIKFKYSLVYSERRYFETMVFDEFINSKGLCIKLNLINYGSCYKLEVYSRNYVNIFVLVDSFTRKTEKAILNKIKKIYNS